MVGCLSASFTASAQSSSCRFYGLLGGGGALGAALYNLFAGIFGGIAAGNEP